MVHAYPLDPTFGLAINPNGRSFLHAFRSSISRFFVTLLIDMESFEYTRFVIHVYDSR